MKRIFALALLALAACTTTDISPAQNYRLGNEDLNITGNLVRQPEPPLFLEARHLNIFINGEQVISGKLGANFVGELRGKYKKHSITAMCSSEWKTMSWIAVTCPILIDEKRTVTLTF